MKSRTASIARAFTAVTLLVAVAVAAPSCRKKRRLEGSIPGFAIYDSSNSYLREIDRSGGVAGFCLALIGFSDEERPRAEAWFPAHIARAMNTWNAALAPHPRWPHKGELMINEIRQDTECEPNPNVIRFNVWGDGDRFRKEFCAKQENITICTSSADVAARVVYIGPVADDKSFELYNYFTVLHEYGHMLGLGDTYQIRNHQEWEGEQPPSVMNGRAVPQDQLTVDDRMGIWAVLNEIRTGKRTCEGFGAKVPLKYNSWRVLMCDPMSMAVAVPEPPNTNQPTPTPTPTAPPAPPVVPPTPGASPTPTPVATTLP